MQRRYKAVNEKFLITGMQTALLPYQFAAVGWMVQREGRDRTSLAGGGLLADTMGLGKTVQMLACSPPARRPTRTSRAGGAALSWWCPRLPPTVGGGD